MELLIVIYMAASLLGGTGFVYCKYCYIIRSGYYDDPTFAEGLAVFFIGVVLSPFIFPFVLIVGFLKSCKNVLEKISEVIEEKKCQK